MVNVLKLYDDRSSMIVGYEDGSAEMWDIAELTVRNSLMKPSATCSNAIYRNTVSTSMCYNRNGTMRILQKNDLTIELRMENTTKLLPRIDSCNHSFTIGFEFIDEDAGILCCTYGGLIMTFRIDENINLPSIDDVMREDIYAAITSIDGSYFITGHFDGDVYVWDAITQRLIRKSSTECKATWVYLNSLAITPKGKQIIFCNTNGNMKVFDRNSLEEVQPFISDALVEDVISMDVSRDMTFLVTISRGRIIRIWDLNKCDGSHSTITPKCSKEPRTGIMRLNFAKDGITIWHDQRRVIATLKHEFSSQREQQ